MTDSLRALLAGAIDYAGMFPPAGLPLEQAVAKYRQYRSGPEAWMVGRFVCPADKLDELGSMYSLDRDGKLAIVVPQGESYEADVAELTGILTRIRNKSLAGAVDTLEFRWQGGARQASVMTRHAMLHETASSIQAAELCPMTMFFELPLIQTPHDTSTFRLKLEQEMRKLDVHNQMARTCGFSQAGCKIRCGGASAGAMPSSPEVAAVILACRDYGVFWKATAGLHHPFRHVDPELGVPVHGFINLLTAALMADVHRLDAERVQAILDDDDPWHFRFTNEALTWRELSATVPQIAVTRERSLRSFGSCSIEEPWQDLMVLGLV